MILTSIDSDRSVDSRVVVGLLLSMLIVAGCNSESRTTSSSSQSNTEVTELISNIYERIQHQDRRERHIYEEEVERIHTIGLEDESKLFKPGQIVFADSDLIVFDYGDFLLKRYSVSGQKVTTYGNGFGNGPGEFYNPIDAAVGQNHSLHVLDSRQSRVTVFDKTGQYISTVSINSAPPTLFRFAHNANSTRYHFLTFSSKYSLFGYENGLIFPYSDFTNNSGLQTSILLNGNIKSTPNGFVYVAAHLPIIIIFDMSGEIVTVRTTPHHYDGSYKLPQLPLMGSVMSRGSYINGPISVDDENIYIQLRNYGDSTSETYFDVYDIISLDYLHTKIINHPSNHSVIKGHILASQPTDTTVTVYKIMSADIHSVER